MIKGLSSFGYEDRLKGLGLFSLQYRRLRDNLIEFFKFIKGRLAGYFQDMFEISKLNRGRCHCYRLVMKESRTRLRQLFFARRVVGHWNRLSKHIVSGYAGVLQNVIGQSLQWERCSKGGKGLQILMGLDHKHEYSHRPL